MTQRPWRDRRVFQLSVLRLAILAFFQVLLLFPFTGSEAGTLEITFPEKGHAKGHDVLKGQETFSPYTLEELRMLGVVMPPRGARVQETYKGIRFLASPSSRYSRRQLELLKMFIDRTPRLLLNPGPSAIITYRKGEVHFPPGTSPLSLALASGPYVFFDSSSFNTRGTFSAGSTEGVFRAFEHELVHVLQFDRTTSSMDMEKALFRFRQRGLQKIWNRQALDTKLVRSFVEVTGWSISPRSHRVRLHNRKNEKTSSYGKKNVLEDMAETISLVVIGDTTQLSRGRINWAVKVLGFKNILEALKGTFPYSSLYKPVRLWGKGVTRFDGSKTALFRKKYPLVDIEYFVNRVQNSFEPILKHLESEFPRRGWRRLYANSARLKHGVQKRIMAYEGKWRDVYLEVITYDYATGYTLKPSGTIITVLSGYKQ